MTRFLTCEEINDILQVLRPIHSVHVEISENVCSKIKNNIRKQLEKIKIHPSILPELTREIEKNYQQTLITPGEAVGILTAQSIGERQTQLTLNSFHFSGQMINTVVTGVPRLAELLNATKKPKNVATFIHLDPAYGGSSLEVSQMRDLINHKLVQLYLKNLVIDIQMKEESVLKEDPWYSYFISHHSFIYPSQNKVIRLCLDKKILYHYRIPLSLVAEKIEENYTDAVCSFSPDVLGIVDVWLNISGIEKVAVFVHHVVLPCLHHILICGIEGIQQYYIENSTHSKYIQASGYQLPQLFTLPMVDTTKTFSNHMWEIYEMLGIEAVAEFLFQEFVNVISVDSYINHRHINLMVDVMCFSGGISSISRYGVLKNQTGPLSKSSFEESLHCFTSAGMFGEKESMNGVSASIMVGKIIKSGTGVCDLLYKTP